MFKMTTHVSDRAMDDNPPGLLERTIFLSKQLKSSMIRFIPFDRQTNV